MFRRSSFRSSTAIRIDGVNAGVVVRLNSKPHAAPHDQQVEFGARLRAPAVRLARSRAEVRERALEGGAIRDAEQLMEDAAVADEDPGRAHLSLAEVLESGREPRHHVGLGEHVEISFRRDRNPGAHDTQCVRRAT